MLPEVRNMCTSAPEIYVLTRCRNSENIHAASCQRIPCQLSELSNMGTSCTRNICTRSDQKSPWLIPDNLSVPDWHQPAATVIPASLALIFNFRSRDSPSTPHHETHSAELEMSLLFIDRFLHGWRYTHSAQSNSYLSVTAREYIIKPLIDELKANLDNWKTENECVGALSAYAGR
jgi:hypothetical protein